MYMRHQLRENSALHPQVLAMRATDLITEHQKREKTAFQTCYSLLLGREASTVEANILERMGDHTSAPRFRRFQRRRTLPCHFARRCRL